MLMASRKPSAGTWRIRNGGWEDEIVRNLRRQRHLDGRRQTIRLQTGSADCSIYFNYGRGMAVGDFSASLEMTGRGKVSVVRCRLTAAGFRRAFGNPPSPLRGPLPPDKQWGAREYIGARHPVSFGVGRSNGVRALANAKCAFPFEAAKGLLPFERKQIQSSPAGGYVPCPQKKTAGAVFFHISIPGPVLPGSGRCPGYRSGWMRL